MFSLEFIIFDVFLWIYIFSVTRLLMMQDASYKKCFQFLNITESRCVDVFFFFVFDGLN